MIDFIHGTVAELNPTYVVLEAGGLGYQINITLPTYSLLADKSEGKLYVHEAIREDAHDLYGFPTKGERQLFLALITVSGVGPGSARAIMSGYTASEIRQLIAVGNAKGLSNIKGLGIKTAQKIIVELKDKVLKIDLGDNPGAMPVNVEVGAVHNELYDEAVQALVALGYAAAPSGKVVQKLIAEDPAITVAQVIRKALKML
ncbi:MAG: Holliday junction branch migration protein RuvA [Paludibacteraceae bacterium]|nr:Holliday junction branch migration protein RuvA [Paludibacteraceae bacterium]